MTSRILVIASGGGHWQQLMEVRAAWAGQDALHVTTIAELPERFEATPFRIVPDCNRDDKRAILACGWALGRLMLSYRPHVVLSTGALPGVMALALGKMMGARTIWLDSVANAEEMSMSGRAARRFADLWLSQWPHVAEASGAEYAGSIL
ncbi:UDP-N-acetylglucosamine--LPS N-acetylglucosamine transferase [Dinoroseobacter sp. S76]|uniref:UDP-N-acetylglucosamine--LPS N-acetylglucosamine transferase n=1 Tax=Dinoroseobacter sp. S76 TaxID=3415124 RepID=UPI003C7DD2D9